MEHIPTVPSSSAAPAKKIPTKPYCLNLSVNLITVAVYIYKNVNKFSNQSDPLPKNQGRHGWQGPQGLDLAWILQNRKRP